VSLWATGRRKSGNVNASALPPAAHEAAGCGAGVLALLKHRHARDQGRLVAFRALHEALTTGREVMHDLGSVGAQPFDVPSGSRLADPVRRSPPPIFGDSPCLPYLRARESRSRPVRRAQTAGPSHARDREFDH